MSEAPKARKPRHYSRTQTRQMFIRIEETKEANRLAEIALRLHRATDPFELAKLALQRRGWCVFHHSIHVAGSELIVVGTTPMTREAVIAKALRFMPSIIPQPEEGTE